MRPSNRSEARQLVESIAKEHGTLGEAVYSRMEPDVRRQVEEAILKKDENIGPSVIDLAKNLYSSSAKFVFELLQNADNNSYSRAQASSVDPFVSFHVYNRRIVIECNEDGFTNENLAAICNIRKSSEFVAPGNIGEKAIGFKSVFMVAWKAVIQSGKFSFYFQHKKGDSGMGMISPAWQHVDFNDKDDDEVAKTLTRITLFLHYSMLDDAMETTRQQFLEIESTLLLFMKNLKRINVTRYDENDEQIRFTTYSIKHRPGDRVELHTETLEYGETELYSERYYLTKQKWEGFPKSENRDYTSDEISQKAFQTAEIILAFPLDDTDRPIIKSQQIYNFLPIRETGFSFLVQTDFDMDASRQDIVNTSARNSGLLFGIAKAFVTVVSQFCEHPTLRYHWMRYLPQEGDYPRDEFWGSLFRFIRSELQKIPVLWTRSHRSLRPTGSMRRLRPNMLDHLGNPLFPDTILEQYLGPEVVQAGVERYLASEYLSADLDRLKEYGLGFMGEEEFLDKLELDLKDESFSRVKSTRTDDQWHTCLANCLTSMLSSHSTRIRSLPLIPLIGGGWTSAQGISIFFSQINDEYSIPTDLGLRLVDLNAEKNPERKRLFHLLGVKKAGASGIRKLIVDKYRQPLYIVNDLNISRSHLNFLYLTEHLIRTTNNMYYSHMHILDHECQCKKSDAYHPVYFSDDNPYGPRELFHATKTDTKTQDVAPGLDVSFIHHEYIDFPPKQPDTESRSWKSWLRDMFNVYDFIPLYTQNLDEDDIDEYCLSKECLYVAEHRPEKFLGFLVENWRETDETMASYRLRKDLSELDVLCESGRKCSLEKTYLPIAEHQEARKFFEDGEFFPWLYIEDSLRDDETKFSKLQVLVNELDFGFHALEIDFYIDILDHIFFANEDASKLTRETRVYDLYGRIVARYRETKNQDFWRKRIQNAFWAPSIYVPASTSREACWASKYECVWDAPVPLKSEYVLKWCYEGVADIALLVSFFCEILEIPNAGMTTLLVYLGDLKAVSGPPDFNQIYTTYRHIHDTVEPLDESDRSRVLHSFEHQHYVYHVGVNEVGPGYWCSPSDCLWSTTTEIKGKRNLSHLYKDLFAFFVDFLRVPTLTLEMVVDKLAEQGEDENSTIEDIKDTIWQLNALLRSRSEMDLPDPSRILEAKVFPVRYPSNNDNDSLVELCSSTTDFTIVDRGYPLNLFSDKVKRLDFSVNDILRLELFFRWTGLEHLYLSLSVEEITGLDDDNSGERLLSPDRDIALKAHGLLRIAVHFHSPRIRNGERLFYDDLKKIKVYETDGITSQLCFIQDGKSIIVEPSTSELHLQDHEDGLRIYVPIDEDLQYSCFFDRLPARLLQWIMTDPSTESAEFNGDALQAMWAVMHAQNRYISTALDRCGIVSIETPDDSVHDSSPRSPEPEKKRILGDSHSESDWERDTLVQVNTQHRSPATRPVDASDVNDPEGTFASTTLRSASPILDSDTSTSRQGSGNSRIPLSPELDQPDDEVDHEYLEILRSTVTLARKTVFPSRGTYDTTALARSLAAEEDSDNTDEDSNDSDDDFILSSSEKIERDEKIGAAGELFVFEILSHLTPALPDFSRGNWQSTVRHYVRIHDDYTDITRMFGLTTIVYHDREGTLTKLFVEKGYLDASLWLDRRPLYFMDVKSTTGPCDDAFSMSASEYGKMRMSTNANRQYLQDVYVVFRVFNVGKDSIEMKIYVDPELMRTRNELQFHAERWRVVPVPS